MRKLIEAGYVYIAQPPLYKVKRGRLERYVQNEREMDKFLAEAAADGGVLSGPGRGHWSGEKLASALDALLAADRILGDLERRGVPAERAVAYADAKRVPLYEVETADGTKLLYEDEEYDRYLEVFKASAHNGAEAKLKRLAGRATPAKGTAPRRNGSAAEGPAIPVLRDLSDLQVLKDRLDRLEPLGVSRKELLREPGRAKTGWTYVEGGRRHEAGTLRELAPVIREAAQKGATVQRFKGLGEMNASELWETTMNPAARVLLQVRLADARRALADHIFSILMGDAVEPRRAFIQAHAPEVRTLDI
jgi:DNA gyrase subunit B